MAQNMWPGFQKSLTRTAASMHWAEMPMANRGCVEERPMTHRFLHCFVVTVAVVFAASYATVSEIHAQAPVPAGTRDGNPASKPTPHLADGRPDLNGTWEHGRGFAFLRAQT